MSLKREYVAIEDLVDEIIDNRGKSVPTVEYGIPLIATNCIKHSSIFPTFENIRYINQNTYDNWFRAHIRPNDILFVNKGTPGRSCIVPDPVNFVAAQDMVGLRFKLSYDPYYMLAVLRSSEIQTTIQNNHVGLVIPHFRKQELLKLKLPIVEVQLQKKIGDIFRIISERIEVNNQINDNLEALAKTIYDYWFVQFDFPDENGKPYKSSGGRMVYNEVLKREIPIDWEVKKLYEVSNITMGQSPSGGSLNKDQDGIFFFQGSTDFGWRYPANRVFTNAPTRFAKENDILLSVRAPIGAINLSFSKCCIGRGLAALNSKQGFSSFLLYQMNYFKKKFDLLNSVGTTFGSLTKDELHNLVLAYPSIDILAMFEKKVSILDIKVKNNSIQNQQLTKLRDWLLPMLMNGQVSVK